MSMMMMMRKLRGLCLGRRLVRIWRWALKRPPPHTHKQPSFPRPGLGLGLGRPLLKFGRSHPRRSFPSKFINWGRRFTRGLRVFTCRRGGDYCRIDGDGIHEVDDAPPPPKGHLAVYVGGGKEEEEEEEGGPPLRYLVPVLYFNHPLFRELLREAEAEFGFHQPGGIAIPCPVSRFERVQTRIAAAVAPATGKRMKGHGRSYYCYNS